MIKKKFIILLLLTILYMPSVHANEAKDDSAARLALYKQTETLTGIPWYYLAGIDQFERSLRLSDNDGPPITTNISIQFSDEKWSGTTNPNAQDSVPESIQFFDGIGIDGNGDGIASRDSDEDLLMSMAELLSAYGYDREHFKIGLWKYYHSDRVVSIIMNDTRLFEKYGALDLQKKVFPVPTNYNHSYRDTWAMARGWGGRRSHEGTDIFADYGTPVLSTCYGVVEMKGWNKFGGWRIGIRDINNTYHYYAHLNSFAENIAIGDIVEPGQTVGSVGSSGYGPKGTSGKFPPHLHYGMYKARMTSEWAFNPYPFLQKWERESGQ